MRRGKEIKSRSEAVEERRGRVRKESERSKCKSG